MSRQVSSGAEPEQGIRRPWSAGGGVHSALKAHALSGGYHRLQDAHQGLHEPPRRRPKVETMQPCRRRLNRSPALGFPPVLKAGKNGGEERAAP
jgi:hypothetical protein